MNCTKSYFITKTYLVFPYSIHTTKQPEQSVALTNTRSQRRFTLNAGINKPTKCMSCHSDTQFTRHYSAKQWQCFVTVRSGPTHCKKHAALIQWQHFQTYAHSNDNAHTRNECTGFLPGHASFAYFFLLGSNGPGAAPPAAAVSAVGSPWGCAGSTSAASGTSNSERSGARFGIFRPSLAAIEDTASPASPADAPPGTWSMS